MKASRLALAAFAVLSCGQALACYTVYDRDSRIIYNDPNPPVDMSVPLHQSLPKRFPAGASMVWNDSKDCPSEARLQVRARNGKSPLITDQKTADELKLPHKSLGNGLAVVSERPDTMRPGVMLAESGLPVQGDTQAMGAAAAPKAATQPAPMPGYLRYQQQQQQQRKQQRQN